MSLPLEVRQLARDMRAELIANRLTVVTVPAPEPRFPGQRVRVATCHNPEWYSALCAAHAYTRLRRNGKPKMHTRIERARVVRSLARIAGGKPMRRKDSMDAELIQVVESQAMKQQTAPF